MLLANNDFLHQNIQEGATQLLAQNQQNVVLAMHHLYQNTLGRLPTEREKDLVKQQLGIATKAEVLEDLIWAVLALPEFQFL